MTRERVQKTNRQVTKLTKKNEGIPGTKKTDEKPGDDARSPLLSCLVRLCALRALVVGLARRSGESLARSCKIGLAGIGLLWLLSGTLNSVPSMPLLGVVRP